MEAKKNTEMLEVLVLLTDNEQDNELTVESIRGSPLSICTVEEIVDDDHVIISIKGVLEYLVGVASFVDRDLLEPGVSALVTSNVQIFRNCNNFSLYLLLVLFKRILIVQLM